MLQCDVWTTKTSDKVKNTSSPKRWWKSKTQHSLLISVTGISSAARGHFSDPQALASNGWNSWTNFRSFQPSCFLVDKRKRWNNRYQTAWHFSAFSRWSLLQHRCLLSDLKVPHGAKFTSPVVSVLSADSAEVFWELMVWACSTGVQEKNLRSEYGYNMEPLNIQRQRCQPTLSFFVSGNWEVGALALVCPLLWTLSLFLNCWRAQTPKRSQSWFRVARSHTSCVSDTFLALGAAEPGVRGWDFSAFGLDGAPLSENRAGYRWWRT